MKCDAETNPPELRELGPGGDGDRRRDRAPGRVRDLPHQPGHDAAPSKRGQAWRWPTRPRGFTARMSLLRSSRLPTGVPGFVGFGRRTPAARSRVSHGPRSWRRASSPGMLDGYLRMRSRLLRQRRRALLCHDRVQPETRRALIRAIEALGPLIDLDLRGGARRLRLSNG